MRRSCAEWAAAGALLMLAGARIAAAECPRLSGAAPREALANENRVAAGSLHAGTLTVRLVARAATWHPDGPGGCALRVNSFAEEGKPASIPGPLLNVRAGTDVIVSVRNALAKPLWLRGLQDRTTGSIDSVEIAPESSRT